MLIVNKSGNSESNEEKKTIKSESFVSPSTQKKKKAQNPITNILVYILPDNFQLIHI